ncbi:MAG: DUF4197 domain-containing protein [Breznakibacter sp.]|nr:DUF4197 domain-containing protein [Breznakibacter sp.]
MKNKYLALVLSIALSSCAELQTISKQLNLPIPLTEAEVSMGLKEALSIGTQNATGLLSATDGYFGDAAVKILLPEEAQVITKNISRLPGGDALVEKVVLSINRAAEEAAKEAAPIFIEAVKTITITDAMAILGGGKNAATEYFRTKTKNNLVALYAPKISNAIDQKLVGDLSAQSSWNLLTGKWNQLAKSPLGAMASLTPVETNLSQYLTEKAIDGLFLKIALEEEQIRTNPAARVNNLLRRVFGQ